MKRLTYLATMEGNPLLSVEIVYPVIRGNSRLNAKAKAHAEKTLNMATRTLKNAARASYIAALRQGIPYKEFVLYETYRKIENKIEFTCYIFDGNWTKKKTMIQ